MTHAHSVRGGERAGVLSVVKVRFTVIFIMVHLQALIRLGNPSQQRRIHYNEYLRDFLLATTTLNPLLFISMNTRQIGEVITARRDVLGIDQRTLSEISEVAVHTLSNIEAGKGNPTVKSLNKILGALGMELRVHVQQ